MTEILRREANPRPYRLKLLKLYVVMYCYSQLE